MIPLIKMKSWKEKAQELSSLCAKLNGTFVPDDDEKAFACIVPDYGLNVSYFRDKDLFIVALSSDGAVMSVASRRLPDFTVSGKSFLINVEKPDVAKVFSTSNE